MDLGPEELFVLAALRAWVAPRMRPGADHPDWRAIFRLAAVGAPGAVAFDLLMSVIGSHAQRSVDVRCPPCPSLSADEEGMLRLVAALQEGEALGALDVLADWLPQGALSPALGAAQRFAALTAAAGLRLPASPLQVRAAQQSPAMLH